MSTTTLPTRPLDVRLLELLVERQRKGVTCLHPRLDLPRLLDATPRAVRGAMRRLVEERRILVEWRPGAAYRFHLIGDTCTICGSRLR